MEKLRREKRLWVIVFKRSHILKILNWMPLIKGVDVVPLNGDLNGERITFRLASAMRGRSENSPGPASDG
jgi:hypothetical protein